MSKAIDSINRNQFIEDLRNITEKDELRIISTLLNVSLSVRCENTLSKVFEADTGATVRVHSNLPITLPKR